MDNNVSVGGTEFLKWRNSKFHNLVSTQATDLKFLPDLVYCVSFDISSLLGVAPP